MRIGAAFNPYRVFQGAFAPFWLLEHRGLGAGAKLCYIRLLGFAGKDGRCYPSLETLGRSLGVSDRQARDYVKELEKAGLIVIEQRGLRKTNVYLFVWTAELERLVSSVPDTPSDPEDETGAASHRAPTDRNNCSAQDRNHTSAPDRNTSSGQDWNRPSGPLGISSSGIGSLKSSSSSAAEQLAPPAMRRMTKLPQEAATSHTQIILEWAGERAMRRLRTDRAIGLPDTDLLAQWTGIFESLRIDDKERIVDVLDAARAAADRMSEWRNWSYLTLQIQLAAERTRIRECSEATECRPSPMLEEEPDSEWARIKANIRIQIGDIPYTNWFDQTRQIEQCGTAIAVAVPDQSTREYVESEYRQLIDTAAAKIGIERVRFIVDERSLR